MIQLKFISQVISHVITPILVYQIEIHKTFFLEYDFLA